MTKKINYLFGIMAMFFMAGCSETLEETYDEYTQGGMIRYLGKCSELQVNPGWERLQVVWKNNIDPGIDSVKITWQSENEEKPLVRYIDRMNVGEEEDLMDTIYLENLAAQSYSLGSLENYLQVTAHDLPEQFVADDVQNSIQINAGNSDYGWSVIFDSGVVMGMCDVKEYQLRNGKLPTPNGALCYGFKRMNFSGVQKIVCYEVPRYFSYIR